MTTVRSVEMLYFDGCPNHASTVDLAHRVVDQWAPGSEVSEVAVTSDDEAQRLRFLGSPSVRVDGLDVELGASARTTYQLACRLYRPSFDEEWLAAALRRSRG